MIHRSYCHRTRPALPFFCRFLSASAGRVYRRLRWARKNKLVRLIPPTISHLCAGAPPGRQNVDINCRQLFNGHPRLYNNVYDYKLMLMPVGGGGGGLICAGSPPPLFAHFHLRLI